MIKDISHIKNPLTLISIFAGIAEVSGASILPFIEVANQRLYIYFLIAFPIYTVSIFFLTLNFNHRSLYAPSDYKDENHFIVQFGIPTASELNNKLEEETQEVKADTETSSSSSFDADTIHPRPKDEKSHDTKSKNEMGKTWSNSETSIKPTPARTEKKHTTINNAFAPTSDQSTSVNSPMLSSLDPKTVDLMEPYELQHRELMASVALTEKLTISKLSSALNIQFKQDVSFQRQNSAVKYLFDAADYSEAGVQVVEVKLFISRFDASRFRKALEKAHNLSHSFSKNKKLTLHLVVVLENISTPPPEIRSRIALLSENYTFDTIVHITTTKDLQSDSGRFY